MNYRKIYDDLCERGRHRSLTCYKESHHILPRCMGGSNEQTNLVYLTAQEHFVAHQLLVKIYPSNRKLIYALQMMCISSGNQIRSNKIYAWIKKQVIEARIDFRHSDETKEKMSNTRKGRKQTKDWVQKRTDANIGRVGANRGKKFTEEHKQKISNSHRGKVLSQETKDKLSRANIGKTHSEETKQKMRETRSRKKNT